MMTFLINNLNHINTPFHMVTDKEILEIIIVPIAYIFKIKWKITER